MRLVYLSLLLASPATAWEFTPIPICTLSHDQPGVAVVVTFDPALPEYAITITRDTAWPEGPIFQLGFEGPRPSVLSTDRHTLSADGTSLTVRDTGFGNVLDGLAANVRSRAVVGETAVTFDLADAAPAVAAFRACPAEVTS
ncbi:hypothetical protein SAMN04488515_2155 [Cognatiyoonia koreensis]|uniref:Excinuclease ABC subunit B n=1 Tax=Cognatiyoonia koreensis TaxID=364200 RepID=A0A1I0QS54_9RHOB|nr:excinuclease ABC subunit B [Cognatiyoonia koreensis]SEW30427.1 hypothetical protein SAMN04488515_2155 [Cognatiyoonia koreensis]